MGKPLRVYRDQVKKYNHNCYSILFNNNFKIDDVDEGINSDLFTSNSIVHPDNNNNNNDDDKYNSDNNNNNNSNNNNYNQYTGINKINQNVMPFNLRLVIKSMCTIQMGNGTKK